MRLSERPAEQDVALYWGRMRQMGLDPHGLGWSELALRFAAFVQGVATCIVGTTRLENLKLNVSALEHGPLAPELVTHIRDAFRHNDHGWDRQI